MSKPTYNTLISPSGTRHLENPRPTSGGFALVAGRIQTLCHMHLRAEDAGEANGVTCQFCIAEADRLEREA